MPLMNFKPALRASARTRLTGPSAWDPTGHPQHSPTGHPQQARQDPTSRQRADRTSRQDTHRKKVPTRSPGHPRRRESRTPTEKKESRTPTEKSPGHPRRQRVQDTHGGEARVQDTHGGEGVQEGVKGSQGESRKPSKCRFHIHDHRRRDDARCSPLFGKLSDVRWVLEPFGTIGMPWPTAWQAGTKSKSSDRFGQVAGKLRSGQSRWLSRMPLMNFKPALRAIARTRLTGPSALVEQWGLRLT